MGIIQIRPAQREGARTVGAICGVSGSGKTYSALLIAFGMAGRDSSKVGLLDTENRRGSLYSDIMPDGKPFMIGDLRPPFSPLRYAEAVKEFQSAGVEVLVIDSVTHEWDGEGGADDIANAPDSQGRPPKLARWNEAKRQHKRFMNVMIQSDMQIICCVRAREKSKPEKDPQTGRTVYVPLGLQPIQERDFMFEATYSIMMHESGTRHDLVKVPKELVPAFPGTGYLGPETGQLIRAWVDGAKQLDPKVEKFRNRLITVCEQGEEKIKDAWQKTPEPIRKALGPSFFDEILASAQEYDRQRTQFDASDAVENLNRDVRGVPLNFDSSSHGDPS